MTTFATLILLFCLSGTDECQEVVPTVDDMPVEVCRNYGAATGAISMWPDTHPGYVFRGWKCQVHSDQQRPL
jgi:hypothetical protein